MVWELRRDSLAFGDLRERLRISPSVLSQRLRDLGRLGVTERDATRRYRLTGHGRGLARVLYDLNRWAEAASEEGGDDEATEAAAEPGGGPPADGMLGS